jgi:hypothetical protein
MGNNASGSGGGTGRGEFPVIIDTCVAHSLNKKSIKTSGFWVLNGKIVFTSESIGDGILFLM